MRIVVDHDFGDDFATKAAALLAPGWSLIVAPAPRTGAALHDADVLWHVLSPVTEAMLASATRLRLIQKIGVGVNTIALDAARARGIAVCNMPGTNTQAVAETALLLMLAALRRLPMLDRMTRAGHWDRDPDGGFGEAGELSGRTVGLVGYGAVAQRLTPVLRAMGATVIGWSRTPKVVEGVTFTALDDLIARADIVSLHVPLTPDTAGLISRSRIAAMRAGAVLVNTARGGLVDEAALIDAVTSGRIAAALDVFAQEPVAAAHPLLALPNVVVMPHVAWRTVETLERSIRVAADNVDRLAAGAPLEFQVV